jgi:acyl-CoA dehydrogenase
MDFTLSDSALAVHEGVSKLCRDYGVDYWSECERNARFPTELWGELADGGWLGLCIPEAHGGAGQGLFEMTVAVEVLAAGGGGLQASFLQVNTCGFGALTLTRHGTEEQKQALLPGMARGEIEFAFALTEPDAGTNALRIATEATPDGTDYVIRGQKIWITGVERAHWMAVVTRTTPYKDAKPRTNGLTIFLVDVKEAIANGTLQVRSIPKLGLSVLHSY